MQSAKETDRCYTDISSDWDNLSSFPETQFKSKSPSQAPMERKRKQTKLSKCHRRRRRRSSHKHKHNSKRCLRSRSRDIGKRHRPRHSKSDGNQYEYMERDHIDSDTEKYSSFEDLASCSNAQDRHRTSGVDYKMKNKYGRLVKSSFSCRDKKKTIVSSNSDSSDVMDVTRKIFSGEEADKSKLAYMQDQLAKMIESQDQLAKMIESMLNKQKTASSKAEVSPIKTTSKNASMLSTKKEMIEMSTINSTPKTNLEWVDSFDIELAEDINVENDYEIDDEIIQKLTVKSTDIKNEASSYTLAPNFSFDTEVVKKALATIKMNQEVNNPEQSNVIERHVQSPFKQSNRSEPSNDPRLQYLRDRRRDQRVSLSLQVPTFYSPQSPRIQSSKYYNPLISESFLSNERSFNSTEIRSTSISGQEQASLSYASLQHTPMQTHTVTSPTYSGYENHLQIRDKFMRPQNNELERRKYEQSKMKKEYFELYSSSACFKNIETQMTCDESIASAVRNVISETETGPSNCKSKSNSHLDQRVNYLTYDEHRRSPQSYGSSISSALKHAIAETVTRPSNTHLRQIPIHDGNRRSLPSVHPIIRSPLTKDGGSISSTSPHAITETLTCQSNTHPRIGNVSRSANNAMSNSKAGENDRLEIQTTESVNKQLNLGRTIGSDDSKSQKSVNNRCDKGKSHLANVNRSSNSSTYNKNKQILETIFSSTPLNSNRHRDSVCEKNEKWTAKINFKIPKRAVSKPLELNKVDDWDFEAETTGGSESQNNDNINETNRNSFTVENTEPQISMQTIESTSELNENARETSSE